MYVNKVKRLLTGLAATDAEVDKATSGAAGFQSLIDTWASSPEAQKILLRFFAQTFQQTQFTTQDLLPQLGSGGLVAGALNLGHGPQEKKLLANLYDSFARTALAIVKAKRPFTNVLTTQTFELTTAMASLLALIDQRHVDDKDVVTDRVFAKDPNFSFTVKASANIPIEQSIDPKSPNYMVWSIPVPFRSCPLTERTLGNNKNTSAVLFRFLMGVVPDGNDAPGMPITCRRFGVAGPLQENDFEDWHTVTIRPPAKGESTETFWDLPALRTKRELVLNIPRVGFFTTVPFFANWPTTSGNIARVTINQTMIGALGESFNGSGSTVPISESGFDVEHANNPACKGCHVVLDPMKDYFRSTYTYSYHEQKDPLLSSRGGQFAFGGVVADGGKGDVFALANHLAKHPKFASAWVQKLVMWAQAEPALPDDPEFARLASAFEASGFDFNVLLREVFSSPLITGAARTDTITDRGLIVGISRRDHLCDVLSNRLKLPDVCSSSARATSLSASLPADNFTRGAEFPNLPYTTNLFYRTETEGLCQSIAALVVDAPMNSRYSSSNAAAAIEDILSSVMGMTVKDPRTARARQILSEHFEVAKKAGVTASFALKSTFTLACTSPLVVGVGL